MTSSGRDQLLQTIERYFGIAGADAEELLGELEAVDVAGGDWLFHQGELADSLYFLVRGRLQVWIEPDEEHDDRPAQLLGEVTPGESVGEIGLLAGGLRTAGIRAIRDSHLLKLDRESFERFAAQHPNLVMQLAGGVARLLSKRTRLGTSPSRNLRTIAVLPLDDAPWLDGFCHQLTAELGRRRSTLCLTARNLRELGAPLDITAADDNIPEPLKRWLDAREADHGVLLYVADRGDTAWTRLCLRQSDITLLLADADRDPRPRSWEPAVLSGDSTSAAHQALLIRHRSEDSVISGTARWLDQRKLDFHLHLRGDRQEEVARVARVLTGEAVGLVLGGGAARGFAEVGVHRALCEAGIPIDWVGGTSIGGIIGAAIAQDRGPEYVLENSREAFVNGKPFGDYTLPLLSLIRGKRMERLTRRYLAGEIEDLPIPFFCVSTLLDNGELRVHERGPIWRALRATAALPGMLPPAVIEKRLVVDGAVVNNLPVNIMGAKTVGRIIAVDVSSRRTYNVDYEELPSPWRILVGKFVPGARKYRVPGVLAVLMKAAEIGTAAKVREFAAAADLLLRPPVQNFGLTDIRSFDAIVDAGYQYARQELGDWIKGEEAEFPRDVKPA